VTPPNSRSVTIREVGPRDGLQIEPPVPLAAKLRLIEALAATGVRRIEVTSFVSPRAVPALADAEQVAAAALIRWPAVEFSALVASVNGARRAIAAGIARLEYVVSVSDEHSLANTGRTTAESLALLPSIMQLAHAAQGTVEVVLATAWDCPFQGRTPTESVLAAARRGADCGADALTLADTIGTTVPGRVLDLYERVAEVVEESGIDIGMHFHNTRGSGLANAITAVNAGVTHLDASIGGLGGCPFAPGASGNIATEELAYLLDESGVSTGLAMAPLLDAASVAASLVNHPLDSNLYRAGGPPMPRSRS
jgi:hydroxymethylglutaryl-CoA lyase